MEKQFVVVAYDVSDDRRRDRLHHLLEGYGSPVQYSVFECLLDRREMEKVRRAVRRAIRRDVDQVRYYLLCGACARRTEVEGRGQPRAEEPEAIVV
jgi:CRISPR-associated protein Cas2